jgi:hypothetical protein
MTNKGKAVQKGQPQARAMQRASLKAKAGVIVDLLVKPETPPDRYWDAAAKGMLEALVLHLLTEAVQREKGHVTK